jgi:hypothetical protein
LTREAFSWKPFVSETGRVRSSPISAKRGDLYMRTLPPKMVQVLASFAPLFSKRVWQHAQLLWWWGRSSPRVGER